MAKQKRREPQLNVTIRMSEDLRKRLDAAADAFTREHGVPANRSDIARSLLEQALAK